MAHTDKDLPWALQVRSPKKRHPRLMRSPNNFLVEWARCCNTCNSRELQKPQASARAKEKRVWKKDVLLSL